ncbi:SH3 domain-containing protein 19 isoform X3 [Varanus komodoensis]|uniref:SH3 domain-containing protein 19 isoform X3 n=1 Tax=Varanus komodoensis TaxID=61221 RepID=UPI001CF7B734|nr:SH3 domain-containing protein 19 isoform X3 [Varanus komodoensis]
MFILNVKALQFLSAAVQVPRKPPRPSSCLLNSNPSKNEDLLVILEEHTCQEKPNAVICPVPKPRSKGNLKPVLRDTQSSAQDNHKKTTTEKDTPSIHLSFLLDDSFGDCHMVIDTMDTDKNQSSIISRIKAFELQANTETKKAEVSPHSLGPKPIISAKKPVVAPKPGVNRASGDCNSWTEGKLKTVSQERPLPSQEAGSTAINKPELPKKPAIVKSTSDGLLNSGNRSASESSDGQRKSPIPAPRPLVLKKSGPARSPVLPTVPLKPVNAAPRLSIAAQSPAFRSLAEPPASNSVVPPVQSTPSREGDLISFDDDIFPLNTAGNLEELTRSAPDLVSLPSKHEPAKEQAIQSAVVRKPTVIRIPAKPAKALNEGPESPPPLPTEKPIGNTSGISAGKNSNIKTAKKESEHSSLTLSSKNIPIMPLRPSEGKIMPARPPPPKGAPGRPPPPKSVKTSSQMDGISHSSSDTTLHKKPSTFGLGVKKTKSDVIKNSDPALPPRPKPGHPLYNKYMLPVPQGTAKEDISLQSTRHTCKDNMRRVNPSADLSAPHAVVLHDFQAEHGEDLNLHSGETVYLLERIDNEWYRGKCKNRTGIFPASFVKVIVDIPGENNRKKVSFSSPNIVGPRCIARFEYIGDQKDELSFSEGEIIILKKYVNEEWAKGELRGTTGIFPLNFVEVIEDLLDPGDGASLNIKNAASVTQLEEPAGEWCDALHDFTAETQEDLSFKKGDHILILEHLDSEWYRGRLNGKEGIFPAVFVQVCSGETHSSQPAGGKKGKAKALYDFHAENTDELSFKAGDIITELEPVDEEWMSGELYGKSGIFPKNFVQILQFS